jgi:hypothetical protein
MSLDDISIDTVRISVFGVSREVAEQAAADLKGELARRIATLSLRGARSDALDLANVDVGPLAVPRNADATTLRNEMADALGHRGLEIRRGFFGKRA